MRTVAWITLILLAGCTPPSPSADDQLKQAALDALKRSVKDPGSLQTRNIGVRKGVRGRTVVCGEANAKNSFGGYVGFAPFVVIEGAALVAGVSSGDGDRFMRETITAVCNNDERIFQTYPALEKLIPKSTDARTR